MLRRRLARMSGDSGAAALEFALVSFVLFPLVFGMIDYGLFFTDSLGARDGARVAARQGVVEDFSGNCPPDIAISRSGEKDLKQLACYAVDQVGAVGGTTYARVANLGQWARGTNLLVCVAVTGEGVTGLVPMPNDRTVRAKLVMRIEQDDKKKDTNPSVGEANTTGSATPAPSNTWSGWCA